MSTAFDYTAEDHELASPEEQERDDFLQSIGEEAGTEWDASREAADAYLDHMLERLAERERAIASNNEIADRRVLMIEGWRRQQNERVERECQWIRQQLAAIAEGYDFGSKRSRSLPNGTFGYRKSPDRVEIVDMQRAVAFATANGLAQEIKVSIDKTPLKKVWAPRFKKAGEVPDPADTGFDFVPGGDSFFVKTGG